MRSLHGLLRSKKFKRTIIVSFFIVSVLVWFGMWLYGQYYLSTDNAYINANIVQIAPRIPGKVTKVFVENNQYVKANQLLFDIDAEPFQLALDAAKAQVAVAEAQLLRAELAAKRTGLLVKEKYSSSQEGDNATASYKTALAELASTKANLQQANLNLQYTHVTAPTSGFIANVSLREGQVIAPNQPLFALISDSEYWVDANFKETEMAALRSGQKAKIVSDLYPDYAFDGVVESISGGTGNIFSLLPPQNATGNWVKITQRVPVRILILNPNVERPLRVGTSATATVKLQEFAKQTQHHE